MVCGMLRKNKFEKLTGGTGRVVVGTAARDAPAPCYAASAADPSETHAAARTGQTSRSHTIAYAVEGASNEISI